MNDEVAITENLDISEFMHKGDSAQNDRQSAVYDLSSIIIHKGTLNFGHYYALVRPMIEKDPSYWVELNDKEVSAVSSFHALKIGQQSGYLLIYTKKNLRT